MMLAEPIYALRHFHATPLELGILGTAGGGAYALVVQAPPWPSWRTIVRAEALRALKIKATRMANVIFFIILPLSI